MERSLEVAQCIFDSARRVETLGAYISTWEWALFSWTHGVRVFIHTRYTIIDPFKDLMPTLDSELDARIQQGTNHDPFHVAWCRCTDDGIMAATEGGGLEMDATLNHFMYLLKMNESEFIEDDGSELFQADVSNAQGFALLDTATDGNCGIDCMAAYKGAARSLATWKQFRLELAEEGRKVSRLGVWQQGYIRSGEGPLDMPRPSPEVKRFYFTGQRFVHRFSGKRAAFQKGIGAPDPPSSLTPPSDAPSPLESLPALMDGPSPLPDLSPGGATQQVVDHDIQKTVLSEADAACAAITWAAGVPQNLGQHGRKALIDQWIEDSEPEFIRDLVMAHSEHLKHKASVVDRRKDIVLFGKRKHASSLYEYRTWLGAKVCEWMQSPAGQASIANRRQWRDVVIELGWTSADETIEMPRRFKEFLRRCVHQHKHTCSTSLVGSSGSPAVVRSYLANAGKGRNTSCRPAWARVHKSKRRRALGGGNKPKCSELGHNLYQWFVDLRMRVKGRVIARMLKAKARVLLQEIVHSLLEQGLVPDPPVLDNKWMLMWRDEWKVCYKRPNRRYAPYT